MNPSSNGTGSDFSKIIKSLKNKHPDSAKGRGGPKFANKKGNSADHSTQNFSATKNIKQMIGE